ncbi:MAG: phosphotransferase [Planctomycetota bacterium]|jgi:homoserine kinase type II
MGNAMAMTEEDINAIVGRYDVGELRAAVPFDLPGRPWKVTTDAGAFVVRECRLNDDPAEVDFEHRLASWLDARGFPVSMPVVPREGGTWCEVGGRLFALYSYLQGEHFETGNAAQARSAGAELARFHEVASALPGAGERGLPKGYRSPADDAAFLTQTFGGREETASLVAGFRELDARLQRPLPEALLFNDFHPGNVVFAGDGLAGVFDLDCCFWGKRLFDVAMSLLAFALSLEGGAGVPGSATFHTECGRSWLAGYGDRAPLAAEETRLLSLALRRQARVNALYDLRDVAGQSQRWVEHEWDFSARQMALVDAHCQAVVEGST